MDTSFLPQVVGALGALIGTTLGWSLTYFSGQRAEKTKQRIAVANALDACVIEMNYLHHHNSNNLRRLKEYSEGMAPRKLDVRKMKYSGRGFLSLKAQEIASLPPAIGAEMLHFLHFIDNNEIEYDALLEEYDELSKNKEQFKLRAVKLAKRAASAARRSKEVIDLIESAREKGGKTRYLELKAETVQTIPRLAGDQSVGTRERNASQATPLDSSSIDH
ncbi:hypothetical protein [Bradyrhizobium sp. CCGUVB14]|uniref:hypothetical protein n=1 Tax=Bradyrhizobium sp. CCGUVB14 TaxID=2949628 RepID=UPI0020B29CFB|nr:hypothetical protein [Bradyrhizobium sp. CCGUVB14]MCP3447319.1 hypothetical protein [Bradyrhizobium sp. CCGUVB14]